VKVSEFVDLLLETEIDDQDVQTTFDRLMLRLFNVPSLIQYLNNAGVFKQGDINYIQLVFSKLPDEVIPDVGQCISLGDPKVSEFEEDGNVYTGFEIPLDPDWFSKEDTAITPKVGVGA